MMLDWQLNETVMNKWIAIIALYYILECSDSAFKHDSVSFLGAARKWLKPIDDFFSLSVNLVWKKKTQKNKQMKPDVLLLVSRVQSSSVVP